ncbi:MAG: single-stranded DNA-binding protein, partial [Microcystaceae cyanobacterium]
PDSPLLTPKNQFASRLTDDKFTGEILMSDNLNLINLVGRLGQNPELKYFESGAILAKCTLAVSRRRRDEEPDWFELVFWDKPAEILANYTSKGSVIAIQGELRLDEWVDSKTQTPRSKPVIRVDKLELLSSNSKDSEQSSQPPLNSPDF